MPSFPPAWTGQFRPRRRTVLAPYIPATIFDSDSGTAYDQEASSTWTSQVPVPETVTALDGGGPLGVGVIPASFQPSKTWRARFWPSRRMLQQLLWQPQAYTHSDASSAADVTGTLTVLGSESCLGTDGGEQVPNIRADGDFLHGEDSGFTFPAGADLGTAGETHLISLADTESGGPAFDTELTAWPGDRDAGGTGSPVRDAGETEYWTGPLADLVPDAGHGTDGPTPAVFPMAGADACAGADAHIIDVYSFQPPFRWTGGGFEIVVRRPHHDGVREFALWRGERPDGTAYRLYEAFAAGHIKFLSAGDAAASSDAEEVATLAVALHVTPALHVRLEVS